jgi:hypothetical protein
MEERKMVIKDLTALIKEMDLEDLLFMKNQAEVLDHNRKVLKERQDAAEAGEADSDKFDFPSKSKSSSEIKKSPAPVVLRIEQSDNPKYFNLCSGNARIFMDYHEMKSMYQIASAASGAPEAGPRLYRWLKKERSDVLAEAHISGRGSPVLTELYKALIDNFTAD